MLPRKYCTMVAECAGTFNSAAVAHHVTRSAVADLTSVEETRWHHADDMASDAAAAAAQTNTGNRPDNVSDKSSNARSTTAKSKASSSSENSKATTGKNNNDAKSPDKKAAEKTKSAKPANLDSKE